MLSAIVPALQAEERQLVAELRATPAFRKLDAIRRLIMLYGTATAAEAAPAEPQMTVPEIEEPATAQGQREGNKAVTAVRAALAAVAG